MSGFDSAIPSIPYSVQEHALDALKEFRPERDFSDAIPEAGLKLMNKRVLIAGAAGAIGTPLTEKLRNLGVQVTPTDIAPEGGPWGCVRMDVTSFEEVFQTLRYYNPDIVFNMAAAKLAPAGEVNPWQAARINCIGNHNLLCVAPKVVYASTCKAAMPETCYGASKLIAERETLNAGGTVIRYVNVPECGPSMLTIWRSLYAEDGVGATIPYTDCHRYIITVKEAVEATIIAAAQPSGRYKIDAGDPIHMRAYAKAAFPQNVTAEMALRRGDRVDEPLCGAHEEIRQTEIPGFTQVVSYHDA